MICAFMYFLAVALAFLAAIPGCPAESREPLGPLADAVTDPSLPGRWTRVTAEDPEMTITVSESRAREYPIEIAAPGKKAARLLAFLTRADQGPTLNVRQIGAGSRLVSSNRYVRVRYARAPDGALAVTVLTEHDNAPATYDPLLRCRRPSARAADGLLNQAAGISCPQF